LKTANEKTLPPLARFPNLVGAECPINSKIHHSLRCDSKFFALGNLSLTGAGEACFTRGLFLHGTSVRCVFDRALPGCQQFSGWVFWIAIYEFYCIATQTQSHFFWMAATADASHKSGAPVMLDIFIDCYCSLCYKYPFCKDVTDVHDISGL